LALVEAGVEVGNSPFGDQRKALTDDVEMHLEFAIWSPRLDASGPLAQSRFVDEDDGAPFGRAGLGLACVFPSAAGWPPNRPGWRDACGAGLENSDYAARAMSAWCCACAPTSLRLGHPHARRTLRRRRGLQAAVPSTSSFYNFTRSVSVGPPGERGGLRRYFCASSADDRDRFETVW
jgi:hypothetical protein